MEKKSEALSLRSTLLCGAAGTALALALILAIALLIVNSLLPQGREGLCSRCALFLGAAAAAWLACRKHASGKAVRAAASCGILLLFVIFLAVLTKNSSVINISLFYNFLCVIFGGFVGCLTTTRHRRRRRKRN